MAVEGNLPVFETIKMAVRLNVALQDASCITAEGNIGGNTFAAFGFTLAPGVIGEPVVACVQGITMCRLQAGLTNLQAGTRLTGTGVGGAVAAAAAGQFVLGRLLDPVGATPTVANQLARILITREGLA